MAGVKVFVALPRKPGISEQQFHDHWRHPHATWGLGMASRTHYVQSHRVSSALLDDGQNRFDGIAEIWFDSVADAGAFGDDPVYREKLAPDERRFVNMRHVRFLVADEEVLIAGPARHAGSAEQDLDWRERERPTCVKLIQLFDPGDQNWAGEDDLELGRRIGALRHVRSRPNGIVHAKGAFVSGVRELWWPTITAFEEGVAADTETWSRLTDRPKTTSLLAIAERLL